MYTQVYFGSESTMMVETRYINSKTRFENLAASLNDPLTEPPLKNVLQLSVIDPAQTGES